MDLVSPIGVRVSVSDHKGERLIQDEGFTVPQADKPAAPSPVKRTRRKPVKENEDGVRDS